MRLVQIDTNLWVNADLVVAVYWGQQAPVVDIYLPHGIHNYEAATENNGDITDERKADLVKLLATRLMPPKGIL